MIGMTVCSGIGAPELSAPWIDWRYQSEVDPFACAVLAHRFPEARNLGDMTSFEEWPDATVDVLCGGTPCQSFSVAGLRKGLDDPRGNLMLTYLAIARRYRPKWLVWENVPGVLSSNGGRDFGTFLRGLGELGYGFAYRVLDAQYVRTPSFPWAVPQRRRRVFVVGCLGDWRRAAAVLFDAEGMRGDPAPRREAGKAVAPTISARSEGGGGLGTDAELDGALLPEVAGALNTANGKTRPGDTLQCATSGHVVAYGGNRQSGPIDVATACTAHGGRLDFETETLVAFNSREDPEVTGDRAGPLGASTPQAQAIAIQERAVAENPETGPDGAGVRDDGASYTLEARGTTQAVAFDTTQVTSPANYSNPQAGDPCHPLAAGQHPPAIAADWAVRRLTPVECERLMGQADDFTRVPYRNKPAEKCPDGPRYKALGNSWALNCGEFVFERMRAVEAMA